MFSVADVVNPYLLYIKIGAIILALGALIGTGLYIKHVFNDRQRLQNENGALSTKIATEQEKYQNLMKQTQQIMEMNTKIIEAVKRVKINSSVYIDKVEATRLSPPVTGGSVLVPAGLPKALPGNTGLPIFGNNSSIRSIAEPA